MLWATIIPVLCASAQSVPADYKAYFDALEAQKASRYIDVLQSLETVWQFQPESPLKGKAAVLAANCYISLGRASDAIAVLRQNKSFLEQPQGNATLAKAFEAGNDPAGAAAVWQSVYYGYPASDVAVEAEAALRRLRSTLGDRYPPAMPAAVFDRADKLKKAGEQGRAKSELLAAAPGFGGLERELAMVRAHSGDYRGLSALRVTNLESEAEKLYLMHAAARRNSMFTQAEAAMRQLDTRFPESKWTMEALISWANHHVLRNNSAEYIPLYRACYERFPDSAQAVYCHWRASWGMWITRDVNAPAMLLEHAARFPDSENRGAALYFSRRYEEVLSKHPMSFYAGLARAKWQGPMPAANPDPALFTPTTTTRLRIARARQLRIASLNDWTEFELKFAAREQPFVAAMELAEWAADRGNHDQALRFIKGIAKDYLKLRLTAAPERFWKLAFPLPWRSEVETVGRDHGIEPSVLAALIRQESEFNPRAVSRARAYGLTQVLPSTGRSLSRRAGIRGFSTNMLFEPEVNLKLGTMYLRQMLDAHEGQWEFTLATYNAGKSRTNMWQTWYDYREPAEFVETIPFSETRSYVQAVLRNADVYRRIY